MTVQPQSPWLPFVEMFSLFSTRRDDPLTRLVLDARMSQWGRPFWVSTLLHHCRQTHVTYAIRRGVDCGLRQPSFGSCRLKAPGDHVVAELRDRCSLRLGEWPLLMKNWLVSFLERCTPTGEVEALSVSMLITFVCVCSVVLNVEKRKPTTNNQRDVFLSALIQLV